MAEAFRLPDATHVGHAHLRVADVSRALNFYRDILGLHETTHVNSTVSLSATGAASPLIVLTEQPGARSQPPRTAGLYHVAIRLPDRRSLARVLRQVVAARWPLHGVADHGVSEAIYLPDPDGNGLELYRDRPRDQWQWDGDQIAMRTDPLDVDDLLAQDDGAPWTGIDPGTDIGHMHLHVSDLERAEAFYHDLLGLDVTQRSYPGALFLAADGYHHHLGVNTWAGRGVPPAPPDAAGLIAWSLHVPGDAWKTLVERVRAADLPLETHAMGVLVRDPDQNGLVLTK
jgi:catechol 2,3-dioxygenase